MPLSAAQITGLSCQIAKCPAFTSQGLQLLNMILSDLCQTYDFEAARKVYNFNFNSSVGNQSGPYQLPSDWLRAKNKDVFYTIQGVVYPMIKVELNDYDWLVQQAGLQSFPSYFTTDMSQTPPVMFVWVPPSGSFPVTARYYAQMPDVTNTALPPWFPNQDYLITRLAGELMKIVNDDRCGAYLSDQPGKGSEPPGAEWLLKCYLIMQGDRQDIVSKVSLDRRVFGRSTSNLKNTKTIGW